MNMSLINAQGASEVVVDMLRGAQLDTIRVYSLIVQLGFVCLGRAGNFPDEVWVTVSGMLLVEGDNSMVGESRSSRDFFACRASALGDVYRLIGQKVTAASVSDSGALQIHLGGKCLHAEADDDTSLEEVWSVASDSPETTADHRWHVSLDDSGTLTARVPS
jgi:hypothetical protein